MGRTEEKKAGRCSRGDGRDKLRSRESEVGWYVASVRLDVFRKLSGKLEPGGVGWRGKSRAVFRSCWLVVVVQAVVGEGGVEVKRQAQRRRREEGKKKERRRKRKRSKM